MIILGLILLMAWQLQNKIQIVLDVTGGILGIVILFIIPACEAYKSRVLWEGETIKKRKIVMPALLFGLGIAFIVVNAIMISQEIRK